MGNVEMSGDGSEEGEEGFYSREICNNLLHVSRDIGSGNGTNWLGLVNFIYLKEFGVF